MYQIIERFSDSQVGQVHTLYQHQWWSCNRTLEETRCAIDQSQLCLGLVNKHGDVFGFSRVLTDSVFKAVIFDVIISKQMRGQQFGKLMLDVLINHRRLKNVLHLELYCLPKHNRFYKSAGFSTNVAGVQLMRRSCQTSEKSPRLTGDSDIESQSIG